MNDTGIATVFDEIYDSTYRKALTFVTRKCGHAEDIADILQETYAEVYLVLLRRGTGYIGHPEAFVLRVARTKIHRFYAVQEKRVDVVPLEGEDADRETWDLSDREWNGTEDEERAIERMTLQEVAGILRSRPDPVQRAFYLYYHLDLPLNQVAKMLSAKESTVKSWIFRTLREIRQQYGEEGRPHERT